MILERITEDIKQAMRDRQEIRLGTLRMVLSALRNETIAKQHTLSEEEEIVLLQREAKKRKEASVQFFQGGRPELAQKEEQEWGIISAYLPEQMSDEDLDSIVKQMIESLGASSLADMGVVIGAVMKKVQGTADGSRVSARVKKVLAQ